MKVVRTYRFCQKGGELMRKSLAVLLTSLLIVFSCTGCLFAPDPSWGLETQTEETAWSRKGGNSMRRFLALSLCTALVLFSCAACFYTPYDSTEPAPDRSVEQEEESWLDTPGQNHSLDSNRNAGINNWIRWETAPFAGAVFFTSPGSWTQFNFGSRNTKPIV